MGSGREKDSFGRNDKNIKPASMCRCKWFRGMQRPNLIKHFDFAFRGFKFLETEGSNFCGEGSCTNTSPAYATTPIKRKRHLTLSNIAKCLYFCGFSDILFLSFVSIKRFSFRNIYFILSNSIIFIYLCPSCRLTPRLFQAAPVRRTKNLPRQPPMSFS